MQNTHVSTTRVNSRSCFVQYFHSRLFYFIQEAHIYKFADGNSLYSIEDDFKEVKTILKTNFELSQVWFYKDHIALNSGKPLLNN